MNKKKMISLILMLVMLMSLILTGCKEKKHEKIKKEPVELIFYINSTPIPEKDMQRVMGKANKIIEEKIGAHLNLIIVEPQKYVDKMNMMMQKKIPWDLCFTANARGIDFYESAQKGAYADLTELLPRLAPETYTRIPPNLWEDVKVNGKIYASVNYEQWGVTQQKGFRFRKDIVDETGFDWKSLKGKPTLEVLKATGDFIGEALKLHPDMIGWETSASYDSLFLYGPLYWDMEEIGEISQPGWIRYEEPEKVINQFESEEFMEYCKIMRDWYVKGYLRKDSATIEDASPDRRAGKIIAETTNAWPDSIDFPEGQEMEVMSMTLREQTTSVVVSNTRTILKAGAGANAAVAVNADSEHIEKAVELIELLNTDDELYKLVTLGEEGIDYIYDENGAFKLDDKRYFINYNEWKIGQSYSPDFNRSNYDKNREGELRKKQQQIVLEADRNKATEKSPLIGFLFDPTSVKTQLALCDLIIEEMVPVLITGTVDPQTAVPEFIGRLKEAGVDDIIKEKQKQLDAWNASK